MPSWRGEASPKIPLDWPGLVQLIGLDFRKRPLAHVAVLGSRFDLLHFGPQIVWLLLSLRVLTHDRNNATSFGNPPAAFVGLHPSFTCTSRAQILSFSLSLSLASMSVSVTSTQLVYKSKPLPIDPPQPVRAPTIPILRKQTPFRLPGVGSRAKATLPAPQLKEIGATLNAIERSKRLAAFSAVDAHVKPEHKVIGIGSGKLVVFALLPSRADQASKDLLCPMSWKE